MTFKDLESTRAIVIKGCLFIFCTLLLAIALRSRTPSASTGNDRNGVS